LVLKGELDVSQEKPATAFVLSLVAGIFIVIGGIMNLLLSLFMRVATWPGMMGEWPRMMMGWWSGAGIVTSVVGMAIGVIVIYSATMLNSQPKDHTTWGTLILVFSIVSFIGAWAGFGIGLILGIVGGALAISWKPSTPTTPVAPQVTGRVCVQCGRAVPGDAKYCSHCGKELEG